jgi:hypothetical protein
VTALARTAKQAGAVVAALSTLPDPGGMDEPGMLVVLGEVAAGIEAAREAERILLDYRSVLYVAARNRKPRITLGRIADAARQTTGSVSVAINKANGKPR